MEYHLGSLPARKGDSNSWRLWESQRWWEYVSKRDLKGLNWSQVSHGLENCMVEKSFTIAKELTQAPHERASVWRPETWVFMTSPITRTNVQRTAFPPGRFASIPLSSLLSPLNLYFEEEGKRELSEQTTPLFTI